MAKKKHKKYRKEMAAAEEAKKAEPAGNDQEAESQKNKKNESSPEQEGIKYSLKEDHHIRLSVLVYLTFAVIAGLASVFVTPTVTYMITIVAVIVLAWVSGRVIQLAVGKKDTKWLLGNGLVIYFFVWLVSWIFFYNVFGFGPVPA